MADEWEPAHRIQAVGYDPMVESNHEATASGATEMATVLGEVRTLLDSVAFVTKEGDTTALIERVDTLLGKGDASPERTLLKRSKSRPALTQ